MKPRSSKWLKVTSDERHPTRAEIADVDEAFGFVDAAGSGWVVQMSGRRHPVPDTTDVVTLDTERCLKILGWA